MLACSLACIVCAKAVDPLPAGAQAEGRGIEIGFADPAFLVADADLRADVFAAAARSDASIARVIVGWGSVAKNRPLDPTDPADPMYDWSQLDRGVTGAADQGMKILMTIHRAPDWAEGPNRPFRSQAPPGTWMPDTEALRGFAQALATRYGGTYVPLGATGPLPRVDFYEPWNEPNLSGFLTPQWTGNEQVSAGTYKGIINAVHRGIDLSGTDATVIAGATGPHGDQAGGRRTRPERFLRELFCLDQRLQPRRNPCGPPANFDLLSHHPISPSQSPRRPAAPGDVAFRELPDLRRILRAAERHGTVQPPGLRRDLWASEFWWETSPPLRRGEYKPPGERLQARYMADALRILWEMEVPVALFFQVRDDPDASHSPRVGWGTGVQFADGEPKAAAAVLRFPFSADRLGRARVALWVRAPETGRLRVTGRRPGAGRATLLRERVSAGEVVYATAPFRGRGVLRASLDDKRSIRWRLAAAGRGSAAGTR